MKRIAIKLVVFLLLGVVVNVAVAWGCALWSVRSDLYYDGLFFDNALQVDDPVDESRVRAIGISWSPDEQVLSTERKACGFRRLVIYLRRRPEPTGPFGRGGSGPILPAELIRHTSTGWPRWSMYGDEILLSNRRHTVELRGGNLWFTEPYETRGVFYTEFALPEPDISSVALPRPVPFYPLFPGFVINTLFYGVILWLSWSAPFAARRLIRKRRGRCVRCGYDLRHAEHEVCPECGAQR